MPQFWLTVEGQRTITGTLNLPPLESPHDFLVPPVGKFAQLLHDYQTPTWSYKPRPEARLGTEIPETVHMAPFEGDGFFVPLTRPLQEFIVRTMMVGAPGLTWEQAALAWAELTRDGVCFTDRHSWTEGFADYINGVNLQGKPMGWKILGMGGNVVKVLWGNVIEAIDYTQPLPDPARLYAEKPWLFQWCTQTFFEKTGGMEMIDGQKRAQWKVSRFPQVRPANVLVPLFGIGGKTRIKESWRYRQIANGTTYSPYVP